jgi:uncharacterized membrane protein YdfJ with MMPL/SSD domain
MTERLARMSSRRPWLVVGVWVVVIVSAFVLVAMFLAFEGEAEITRTTQSKEAERILDEGFAQEAARGDAISEVVVVRAESGDVRTEATRARVAALADELREAGAERVVTYGDDSGLVSADTDSTVLLLALGRDGEDDVESVVDVVERLDQEPGYRAAVTGERTADADEDAASLEDLKKGELFFGAPLALVVLLLVFGAVVAGLVPLMLAIASIVVALALVALLAQAYDLSVFTQNMLIGMGLALGIDYSLFTLSRYREERLQEREKQDAIATAGATAGRAVLFSGIAFRIRERYTQTGDTDAAIAFGIGSTARIITGAALIIIAVFWGFAMGDTIAFQQMGFGIAVALLIDATIVRSVLVPSAMKLLGERNWYLPRWLSWLPRLQVEGASSTRVGRPELEGAPSP